MCEIDFEIILKYILAILSWPVIVLTIFIWFIRLYKEEVRALIKRIKDVDLPGVKLGLSSSEATGVLVEAEREKAEEKAPDYYQSQVEELRAKIQYSLTYMCALHGIYKKNESTDRIGRLAELKPDFLSRLSAEYPYEVKYYGTRMFASAMDAAIEAYYAGDYRKISTNGSFQD